MFNSDGTHPMYHIKLPKDVKIMKYSNHPDFYSSNGKSLGPNYKKSSHNKKHTELGLVPLDDYFYTSDIQDIDFIYCSGSYILLFSEFPDACIIKGIVSTFGLFTGETIFPVVVPYTELSLNINHTDYEINQTVFYDRDTFIPIKFNIALIKERTWLLLGGELNSEPTNMTSLIKLKKKNNMISVGIIDSIGYIPPRKSHAMVNIKDKVYVHGGENQSSILEDFYILSLEKILNGNDKLRKKYRVVITEVITSGIPHGLKNHGMSYDGNYIYVFGGCSKEKSNFFIRKLSLDTMIWEPAEKYNQLSRTSLVQVDPRTVKFGPVIVGTFDDGLVMTYDTRLNDCSVFSITNLNSVGNYSGLYYYQEVDTTVYIGKISFHPYYNIQPIPYCDSRVESLLVKTLDVKNVCNLKVTASDGCVYANYFILTARGSESQGLLKTVVGNELAIPNYEVELITQVLKFLYTDEFPETINLNKLNEFAKYYNMHSLKSLCKIALSGNKIKNTSYNIQSDMSILYSICTNTDNISLARHSSSLDSDIYSHMNPDFMIISKSTFSCHRLLLYLRSRYLRNILLHYPTIETLELPQFSDKSVQTMIKYCYTSADIDNDVITEVMAVARYMDMQGLFLKCQEQLSRIVTPHNFLFLYDAALGVNAEDLLRFLNEYATHIGFKQQTDHSICNETIEELIRLKAKKKEQRNLFKKNKIGLNIEGETPAEKNERLLQMFPLPSIDDPVPEGLKDSVVLNLDAASLKDDLLTLAGTSVQICNEINIKMQEEIENLTQALKYNRFQDLDSD